MTDVWLNQSTLYSQLPQVYHRRSWKEKLAFSNLSVTLAAGGGQLSHSGQAPGTVLANSYSSSQRHGRERPGQIPRSILLSVKG